MGLDHEDSKSLIILLVFFFILLIFAFIALLFAPGLNSKAKKAGDGQHGNARWITKKEKSKAYIKIDFTPDLWREGKNLPPPDKQGIIVDMDCQKNKNIAYVETDDVHTGVIAGTGAGKTTFWLYANLEYACATGMSFLTTDTKGDLYRNYGYIAKNFYDYNISILDLRNPIISTGNNILAQVNKYMDLSKDPELAAAEKIAAKAKCEKYARLISDNIIKSDGNNANYGANSYFYDAANALLTSVILLVSEFGDSDERHIASVFTLLTELLEMVKINGRTELRINSLLRKLPITHRAKLFATTAVQGAEQTKLSVVTTALSKLSNFIDSEIEQMLCFENEIDIVRFCSEKSAVFVVLPEEDTTKYFLVSLLLQQFYRECLIYADSLGGKLSRKCIFYLDEIGTVPKIEGFDMMFSAARSRGILLCPIIQSDSQFKDKYGENSANTILSNLSCVMYSGFTPESDLAKNLSEALGTYTVTAKSVTRDSFSFKLSASVQSSLVGKSLISPQALIELPKGVFIVRRTGQHPMKTRLALYKEYGITFPDKLNVTEKQLREVKYLSADNLEKRVTKAFAPPPDEKQEDSDLIRQKERERLRHENYHRREDKASSSSGGTSMHVNKEIEKRLAVDFDDYDKAEDSIKSAQLRHQVSDDND